MADDVVGGPSFNSSLKSTRSTPCPDPHAIVTQAQVADTFLAIVSV